jgi:hypothetical protein
LEDGFCNATESVFFGASMFVIVMLSIQLHAIRRYNGGEKIGALPNTMMKGKHHALLTDDLPG